MLNGTEVEMVKSIKFLGVTFSQDLSWHENTKTIIKKSQQRLFFLRRLKEFTQNTQILLNFYRCIIESILTSSFTVWFGNLTVKERNSLNSVVRRARRIIGANLPALEELYSSRLLSRASSIMSDPAGHPASSLLKLLPLGRRYGSIGCSTKRSTQSFFPSAVRELNAHLPRR